MMATMPIIKTNNAKSFFSIKTNFTGKKTVQKINKRLTKNLITSFTELFLIFFTAIKIKKAHKRIKIKIVNTFGNDVENFHKGHTKIIELKTHAIINKENFKILSKLFFMFEFGLELIIRIKKGF